MESVRRWRYLPHWQFGFALLALLLMAQAAAMAGSGPAVTVAVSGRVLDGKTGEPIAKVLVSIREQSRDAITSDDGKFVLDRVLPGGVEFYVSTVGYGLTKQRVTVPSDRQLEIDFYISQDASKRHDEVTVTADPFEPIDPSVTSEHTLNNTEVRNLASAMVDDPIRSVQTFPGASTSDDSNAQFALRGSGFSHMAVYVDGVLLSAPFHTVDEIHQTASLTVFNADAIDSMALISGGFPAKYGERSGSVLDVHMRDGSKEKMFTRADFGVAGLTFMNEGPIGESRKASWLIAGRKSFVGNLLKQVGQDYLAIGYTDLQARLSYQPSSGHQFTFYTLGGTNWFEPGSDSADFSHLKHADRNTLLFVTAWNWTIHPRLRIHTQSSFVDEKSKDRDQYGAVPYRSRSREFTVQQQVNGQLGSAHLWEAGWGARRAQEKMSTDYSDIVITDFHVSAAYDAFSWHREAYVQDTWQILPGRLSTTVGGRMEHFDATGQTLWMPRAGLSWNVSSGNKISLAWGQYGQMPSFRQLLGEIYNPALRAERATQYVAGFEHRWNDKLRLIVEAYDTEHREGIFTPDQEWRTARPIDVERGLADEPGQGLSPRLGPYQRNSLTGYSRGVETTLQRRSANRLSGWISYAFGHTRYRDPADQLVFDGDYDQRHTLNAYGSYRLSQNVNLSAKYRFGSNFPIPGFYISEGRGLSTYHSRNVVRPPAYSRLDLRVSKAMYRENRKMTFYLEVANVLHHSNRGCRSLPILQVTPSCQSGFPVLPAAGLTFEF